jgi:indolepyruvate ferredoxin oxidoreductase
MKSVISLKDQFLLEEGRVYLTGTQALVRLPIAQKRRDVAAGLNTAGFISGYRGSPLGIFDMALTKAKDHLDRAEITFVPGINEDLAATAVLGTQQINLFEKANKDGVFAMWYGKGPGVDRSGDAFRHGNLAGTAPNGGVLLLAGDDHTCKSSTTSHQSEFAFVDAMIPVLNPSSVEEIIEFGMFGWALSRYSGCWTAMKLTAETVDSSVSMNVAPFREILLPEFELPAGGLGIRWPDTPQEQERRLHRFKLPAARAFAQANRIDRVVLGGSRRRLGIITTGKTYLGVRQALKLLGISDERAVELGLCIYKVGMVWPLEPEGLKSFCKGLEAVLVVEEKRALVESQAKDILYNIAADARPPMFGKRDEHQQLILPEHDDLEPITIARAILARMISWGDMSECANRIQRVASVNPDALAKLTPVRRGFYFCSGCPHSTSTKLPEGSRGFAGIGCSWMSQVMDRNTATYTHMGGEGANWIGQAPYAVTKHVFQNLGDGTYFHSGQLAIRAAVAAKVNITYKILYNDAVAMTGGQSHDGELTPWGISHQVRAEGVARIAVVSDDIEKYKKLPRFAENVTFHHRDDLDAVQQELREISGVTVLIYDQTCAAEKRRQIKRGMIADSPKRILINELVCEGCGDCSKQSNCLSVVPVETEFGRKRQIDQSSCNKDFSCLSGFCPSFVTVEGGKLKRGREGKVDRWIDRPIVPPAIPQLDGPFNMLITGVGGTGVVTISAVLAMAAHLEGKGCSSLGMTGLAQKGGEVTTHLRIAPSPDDLHTTRICRTNANVVLGCDLIVAAGKEALSVTGRGHTQVFLNDADTITGDFIRNRDFRVPVPELVRVISSVAGAENVQVISATHIAKTLMGDSIGANLLMVGYAFQCGRIPLTETAILEAVKLNGVAVDLNQQAFRLGRLAASDPEFVQSLMGATADGEIAASDNSVESLDGIVARRVAFLTDYQNTAYANRYRDMVDIVRRREEEVMGHDGALSLAVSRSLFKLMSYKDEYEVARLHTSAAFRKQITDTFEGDVRLTFHLAPPLFARIDPATGRSRKIAVGPWTLKLFSLLAKLKGLRGTYFDLFGITAERRTERALVGEYRALIERLLRGLDAENHAHAVKLAELPDEIRGYGQIKMASVEKVRQQWAESRPLAQVVAVHRRPIRSAERDRRRSTVSIAGVYAANERRRSAAERRKNAGSIAGIRVVASNDFASQAAAGRTASSQASSRSNLSS